MYKDFKEYLEFILNNVGEKLFFYVGFIRPNIFLNNGKEIVPKLSEIKKNLHEGFQFLKERKIPFSTEGLPFCIMNGYEKFVSEIARSKLDVDHIEGKDINKNTHKLHIDNNKIEGDECKKCLLRDYCPKIWKEYAWVYDLDDLKAITDENEANRIKNEIGLKNE
jgi:hypothetical protein